MFHSIVMLLSVMMISRISVLFWMKSDLRTMEHLIKIQ